MVNVDSSLVGIYHFYFNKNLKILEIGSQIYYVHLKRSPKFGYAMCYNFYISKKKIIDLYPKLHQK